MILIRRVHRIALHFISQSPLKKTNDVEQDLRIHLIVALDLLEEAARGTALTRGRRGLRLADVTLLR